MASITPTYEGYKMGHSPNTTASHAARTIHSDAAFLLTYLQPHHHVLDVGCGPGSITVGFSALVPEGSVTGIDLSAEVLDQARAYTQQHFASSSPETKRGKIQYRQADVIKGLPFEDGSFDIVFSSQLFPHLPPPDLPVRALTEMRRVLKPGGILATRDAAVKMFYPDCNLSTLWNVNLNKAIGAKDYPGPRMKGYYRRAGFDVDGIKRDGSKRVVVGCGADVVAGNLEERRRFAGYFTGRFRDGEPFRESWVKAGVSDEEITACKEAWEKWAEIEDAWLCIIQSEILAWN
ncbi:MAG: hypothetical protein M1816_006680 [Peltula sp. TS41687]|nr:MAG: hypothetical protein M1816_006680 [Peltula sp. TS41687]